MSNSRNLLREDDFDDDREKAYDDAPPRRFRFMLHHFRRRRIFVIVAVVLIIAIVIVAAVPKGKKHPHHDTPPVDPNREPYTDIRLPSWVIPKNYKLQITTDFSASIFSGTVDITLQITNRTKNLIVIHAVDLELDPKAITLHSVSNATSSTSLTILQKPVNDTMGLEYHLLYFDGLPSLSDPNNMFVLSINFKGNLSDTTMSGYYLSSYGGSTPQLLATTQFEPTYARRAFPCFDEPGLKATFDISMTVEKGYDVISNMPTVAQPTIKSNDDETQTFVFETTKNMSTYLVCYIVHKFAYAEAEAEENFPRVRVYTTPDTLNQTGYALNATVSALHALNDYFGMNYPLAKLDVVAIPDFSAGAMENWGIVTFRVDALLFDPVTGSASERQRVLDVVVHELAHQWFGNLVTMEWWSDIFLNEGFATYMEYQIVNTLEPSWEFPAQFQIDVHQSAFAADSLMSTHAITNNFTTPKDIEAAFDSITYDKGASVIKILNSVVDSAYGAGEFRKTIQAYLTEYAYSNAAAANLWAKFDSSKVDVPKLMKSWVDQPGFPYITVQDTDEQSVTFTQTRFLQVQPENSPPDNSIWWTFINAVDSKGTTYNWNIEGRTQKFNYTWDTTNGYLLLNADGSGFYRTLYNVSSKYLANLYKKLPQLTNVQRSIVYDDAFNFWRATMIPSGQVLNLTAQLKTETDYVVWVTALSGLNSAYRKLRLVECFEDYQNFVQGLLSSVVEYVGWSSPGGNENHLKDLMRSAILQNAANYGDPTVVAKAFQLWEESGHDASNIEPSVRNTVLRSVVAYGNSTHFYDVVETYKNSTVSAVKVSCLQALAYAPKASLQQAALTLALDTRYVRSQDAYIVFIYMAINPEGLDRVWSFFRDPKVLHVFNTRLIDFKDTVLSAVAAVMSGGQYYGEVERFLQDEDMLTLQVAKTALETIKINQQWIDKNAQDICNWLSVPVDTK